MENIHENNTKEEVKLLKPKNDIVFQSLFNQSNKEITKAFVQALIEQKIEKIVINSDKELLREKPDDKLGILDLQVDVNDNEKIDVEIQLIEKKNFADRLLYYFSRLYAEGIKRGDSYDKAKKVVLIAIIDFKLDLTKEITEIETEWKLREKNRPELTLTNSIEIRIIELDKVRKFYEKNKDNIKAQWMLFLDDPNSKEVREIMEKNEEIKEATVVVKQMSEDEKMQRLAFLREKAILDEKEIYETATERGLRDGMEQGMKKGMEKGMKKGMEKGMKKGMEKGMEKGREENKKEIAKKLYEINMPIEQIAKVVELDISEVKKILEIQK